MSSIQLIIDQREPGQVQVFATRVDASVASLGGISQATLWLPTDLARRLRRDLVERLDDSPAVQQIQPDSSLTREPTCWSWCAGAIEPHGPGECYAEHSIVHSPWSLTWWVRRGWSRRHRHRHRGRRPHRGGGDRCRRGHRAPPHPDRRGGSAVGCEPRGCVKGTQTTGRGLDEGVRTIGPSSRGRFGSCSSLSSISCCAGWSG
jgi:hypothetical protein